MKKYRLEVNTYSVEIGRNDPEISQIITTGIYLQVLALKKVYEKTFKVSGPKVPQGYVVKFEIKEVLK